MERSRQSRRHQRSCSPVGWIRDANYGLYPVCSMLTIAWTALPLQVELRLVTSWEGDQPSEPTEPGSSRGVRLPRSRKCVLIPALRNPGAKFFKLAFIASGTGRVGAVCPEEKSRLASGMKRRAWPRARELSGRNTTGVSLPTARLASRLSSAPSLPAFNVSTLSGLTIDRRSSPSPRSSYSCLSQN